ncbi:MAG: 4Fe-4S binding protein [Clostridiales bacterium]|nr:4Fe-4S binding protein [Clostridiales bacterium]MCF8021646.1 4Fe-4S binding protein [Clostridiales bacterium]
MTSKRIVLRFDESMADKPVISYLVSDYNLIINILKANVSPQKEGTLVLDILGEKYKEGLEYLKQQGVRVHALTEEIIRNEDKCINCGACTAICPSGALYIERPSMEVKFNSDECVVCHQCVKVCPYKAMEVHF